MRAAASAGGAVALGHLGFRDLFDDVYATSAAVMNASYFMTGQEDLGVTVYFDDLSTKRFCDHRRFWKILDVDYVIDEVITKRKPLDLTALIESRSRLHLAAMDRNTGNAKTFEIPDREQDVLRLLRAALSIPVFYGRTVDYEGWRLMDGGLTIPFPILQAIEDGCTDILVLLSHPEEHIHPEAKLWQKLVFQALCAQGRRNTYRAFADHHIHSRDFRRIAFGENLPGDSATNIATFCSTGPPFLHTMSLDRDLLVEAATLYGKRVLTAFGEESDGWRPVKPAL